MGLQCRSTKNYFYFAILDTKVSEYRLINQYITWKASNSIIINYTKHVFELLNSNIPVKGIAHITGGGLLENIPRILPDGLSITIKKKSWPYLPVFSCIQSIGEIEQKDMFRTFNMGIGMVFVFDKEHANAAKTALKKYSTVYEIGHVQAGNNTVLLK